MRRSNRKQAVIPAGATVLEPVGTAPGLVVAPVGNWPARPTVVVLPGPPRELRPMWETARATEPFAAAIAGATSYHREIVRLFGIPESEIASTLRAAHEAGLQLEPLEITTCLRRGEIEIATRYEPPAQAAYDALLDSSASAMSIACSRSMARPSTTRSPSSSQGETIALAESCTGGGLATRLTDRAGASAYFLGGVVVYSDQAKIDLAGVDPDLIERTGAVSTEVAQALARGIAERFSAQIGVGVTGIAGPGGGTEDKPAGTVFITVWHRDGRQLTRRTRLPGSRTDVRDRSVTVAMHMLRRLLRGESDGDRIPGGSASTAPTRAAGEA